MSTDSNLQNNYDASRQNYSRTLLLSLLTFTLLAFFSLVPVASVFADSNFAGEGNEASPFLISDAEGLAKLAQLVNASGTNATYKVKHYKLTSDIDLSGYQADVGWAPIGTNVTYNFSGTFDGDYHKITGLVIKNASTNNQGVFGYLNGGVVKNLGVENADVEGKENVGGIAGYANVNASVTNCYTSGTVSGAYYVGGIVGYVATGSVRNCYSTSNVTGTNSNVGGVVGILSSTGSSIENCFSQGVVIGNSYVGGVVGRINHTSASVTNCVALNPSVSAMSASTYYLGHVSGGTTGTLTNSYYRSDMVKGEESRDFNNSKDGTSTEQVGAATFWTGTVNWDGDTIWSFKDNQLPQLKGFLPPAPTNNAPKVKSGKETQTGAATPPSSDGKTSAVQYTADVSEWFEDDDDDDLTYSIVPGSTTATSGYSIDSAQLVYAPPADDAGADKTITVKANDGTEDSGNVTITVTVGAIPADTPDGSVVGSAKIDGETAVADLRYNKADKWSSDGWKWDAASATLTLDGGQYGGAPIAFETAGSVTLKVDASGVATITAETGSAVSGSGNVTISSGKIIAETKDDSPAIYAGGKLTINGEASVEAVSKNEDADGGGISAVGDIEIDTTGSVTAASNGNAPAIEGGKVTVSKGTVEATAKGDTESTTSIGILSAGDVVVSGGNVTAAGENAAIESTSGSVTISNEAKVTAESEGTNSDGIFAGASITIDLTGSGTLNATGKGTGYALNATDNINFTSVPANAVTLTNLDAETEAEVVNGEVKGYEPDKSNVVYIIKPAAFVAVTDIIDVPTNATAGTDLTLSGTVKPATATNKTIVWSVKSAGTTGAGIAGGKLTTTAAGTATITAAITNGASESGDYTEDFDITVSAAPVPFVAVTDIIDVPTNATAGTDLTLSGTVKPATATNKTIVWSVKTAGTTGADIAGGKLSTTAAGTVAITAAITNGASENSDYTKDFDITVSAAANTGNTNSGGTSPGNTDPGGSDSGDTDSGSTDPGDSTTLALPVPGGSVTVPSDTVVNPATGIGTMPSGGSITLTDGATELIVPENTIIDTNTGVITVSDGGVITLLIENPSGGFGVEYLVPAGTTIDPTTGTINVPANALTLPGADGVTGTALDIGIIVPAGATIDPVTGLVTLANGGWITLPGSNRAIDSFSRGLDRSAAAGDDMEFYVTAGTTIDPFTGIAVITNGGEITLPDRSTTKTVAPGTTINAFTGEITEPRAGGEEPDNGADSASGGCNGTGMGAAGLLGAALAGLRLFSFRRLYKKRG